MAASWRAALRATGRRLRDSPDMHSWHKTARWIGATGRDGLSDSRLASAVAEVILAGASGKRFYEFTAWAVMQITCICSCCPVPPPQITHWIKGDGGAG